MTTYRIFPAIGIARLGQDDNFFLCPEIPGQGASELQPDASIVPVKNYKDNSHKKIRKQGARFHLFQSEDGQNWTQATLPETAVVTWKVSLANKKSAVKRNNLPPTQAERPVVPAGNEKMIIDGGTLTITGRNASSPRMAGTYETTNANGTSFKINVSLGQLKTDADGRLIVLGGDGVSGAPANTQLGPSFYRNPKWFDDVSDGPVNAEIILAPGQPPVQVEGGAWVIVAPPDYAPAIQCMVTLYDVIRQVGIDMPGSSIPAPGRPSFQHDIEPIINRVKRLRWVHEEATWSDPGLDDINLGNTAAAHNSLRKQVLNDVIMNVQNVFSGHVLPTGPAYRFRQFQIDLLNKWAAGNFDDIAITPIAITAQGLTQSALETAAGQGFCPGIEAGIIVTDPNIYVTPFDFRIDQNVLKAGDMTALMAQPWQADFVDCNDTWWPTQRPDLAFRNATSSSDWARGANSKRLMVENSPRLGMIVRSGPAEVFIEQERDPSL